MRGRILHLIPLGHQRVHDFEAREMRLKQPHDTHQRTYPPAVAGEHVQPIGARIALIPVIENLERRFDLHHAKSRVPDAGLCHPRCICTRNPRSADVVEVHLTPLFHLVGKRQAIQMINENVAVVLKALEKPRIKHQVINSNDRTEELPSEYLGSEPVQPDWRIGGGDQISVILPEVMFQLSQGNLFISSQIWPRGKEDQNRNVLERRPSLFIRTCK